MISQAALSSFSEGSGIRNLDVGLWNYTKEKWVFNAVKAKICFISCLTLGIFEYFSIGTYQNNTLQK